MEELDTRLAALLTDTVEAIEPTDRLDEIRDRTRRSAPAWRTWFVTGGVAVAGAAVVTAIAFSQGGPTTITDPDAEPDPARSASTPISPDATQGTVAVPVYYVGDTPAGLRLFREFTRVPAADPAIAAVQAAVDGEASDSDYRSAWPAGTRIAGVHLNGTGEDLLIEVVLADDTVRDRPSGLSEEEAAMAVEQVLYTAQGVAGARAPVQFRLGDNPVDQVLGVPTSEPLANGPVLETLSLVSLDLPQEGKVVSDGTLEVKGAANGYEGTVVLRLERADGTGVVDPEPLIAGFGQARLFPFETVLDVSEVPPGSYVLTAMTEDPSAGAEGHGAFSDDRVVVIE